MHTLLSSSVFVDSTYYFLSKEKKNRHAIIHVLASWKTSLPLLPVISTRVMMNLGNRSTNVSEKVVNVYCFSVLVSVKT